MSWREHYDQPDEMTRVKDRNRIRAVCWSGSLSVDGIRLTPYAISELRESYSRILNESEDLKEEVKRQRAEAKRNGRFALFFGAWLVVLAILTTINVTVINPHPLIVPESEIVEIE